MKRLGILGGMGHHATMKFYNKILEHDRVANDMQRIPCNINMQTSIPSRTLTAINGDKAELVIGSVNKIRMLLHDSDIICAPCNSFHYFRDDILCYYEAQYGWGFEWPDMVEIVSNKVKNLFLSKRPLILGGWIVNNKREKMYSKYFPNAVYLDKNGQGKINDIITSIKFGTLKNYNFNIPDECDSIILACTELIQIEKSLSHKTYKPVWDSSSIYAEEIVKLCKET